jgi:glycosyltransferase involved in cell wall biosynthesis
MRILYHHRTASSDGQAVHIEEMIAALRRHGHEVRVVSPGNGDHPRMGGKIGWAHWLKSALPKSAYELLELSYSIVAFTRLARAIRAFHPHVIYERYNLFLMGGLLAKRWFGVPLMLEVNAPVALERSRFGGLALPRLARWSEHAAWKGADRVLPVTEVLAQDIVASGVSRSRITVVANGVNEAHFAGAPTPETAKAQLQLLGRLVLGFTGFIRDWHSVDRVIRWMASSRVPTFVHLLVVGDGPARPALERLALDHNLQERVTFTGVVPRERIPEYVAAFDIALQPAVVPYASPLKVFEYLALGKAIVAPRQPNIEEILTDRLNAILFDPDDPNGLSRAIETLVNDDALRAELGVRAAKTIREKGLTWTENATRVSRLCESVVSPVAIDSQRCGKEATGAGSGETP